MFKAQQMAALKDAFELLNCFKGQNLGEEMWLQALEGTKSCTTGGLSHMTLLDSLMVASEDNERESENVCSWGAVEEKDELSHYHMEHDLYLSSTAVAQGY